MLTVTDLFVSYGHVRAVQGVSFEVGAGQIVSLIGANGAGKSTILNSICGLVKLAAGRIAFEGEDITHLPPHAIVARDIVQVPEGRAILAQMTVRENLELGGYRRRDRAALHRDIQAMLERFPILGERRQMLAGTLSGGEQQMLAIARGLLARPRLLLLDEPSIGLAPQLVKQIFAIVAELQREGNTILLVEQNAKKALALADYAYVVERGRVALAGTGTELQRDPQVVRAYLGGSVEAAM